MWSPNVYSPQAGLMPHQHAALQALMQAFGGRPPRPISPLPPVHPSQGMPPAFLGGAIPRPTGFGLGYGAPQFHGLPTQAPGVAFSGPPAVQGYGVR